VNRAIKFIKETSLPKPVWVRGGGVNYTMYRKYIIGKELKDRYYNELLFKLFNQLNL